MKVLDPVERDGKWVVDLRPIFPSSKYVVGPSTLSREEAIHAAYAKLEALRAARLAEPHAQLELTAGAPPTFAGVVDRWQSGKRVRRAASEPYVRTGAMRLRKYLGSYALADFCDGHGSERMAAFLDRLVADGFAPRTVRNIFSTLGQVLDYAADPERRWLPFVPRFPKMPAIDAPDFAWIAEEDFRRVRARIYADVSPAQLRANLRREGITTDPALDIEQRKLYLSWALYTGSRTHDCNAWTADDVALDIGVYLRHGRKTGALVEQFPMPEPLVEDLRAYLAFCRREHFHRAEALGGGAWSTCTRVIGAISAELQLGPLDVRILRRSFVRKMRLLGYAVDECAAYMGHADTKMIREVYARTPRPEGAARSLWRSAVPQKHGGGVGGRKVLAFPSAQVLKKG